MIFSQDQLEELYNIIDTYNAIFIGTNVGADVLSQRDKDLLNDAGINVDDLPEDTLIDNAFRFGVLAEALGNSATNSLSFDAFKAYIKNAKFIPLTNIEEKVLDRVRFQAYSDITNLGNQMQRQIAQQNIENELRSTVEDRKTIKDMVLALGHRTGEWNRDFGRISDYLMHSAFEEGRAAYTEEMYGDNALVYKDVFPGACRHCIRLYLTGDINSEPRLFKLSELRANGSNIGRKPEEWKATLGPLHPWCRCTLQHYNPDFEWNTETRSYDIRRAWTRRVERRSRIQIRIGNVEYEV